MEQTAQAAQGVFDGTIGTWGGESELRIFLMGRQDVHRRVLTILQDSLAKTRRSAPMYEYYQHRIQVVGSVLSEINLIIAHSLSNDETTMLPALDAVG